MFPPLQPSKLSNNLVQQFLLPDQTPPILEAEMALRAEHLINSSKQTDGRSSSQRLILSPKPSNKQEVTPEPPKQQQDIRSEKNKMKKPEEERIEEVQQVERKEKGMEERQEPEGRQADTTITEHENRREVRLLCGNN